MKRKSIGFKIGIVFGIFHFCLAILAFFAYSNSQSSTAGLVFILFFSLDAPIFLLPSSLFKVFGIVAPLIQFGIFGSALWFSIPWLIDMAFTRIFSSGKRLVRVLIIVIAIPIILAGFSKLSMFSIKLKIQSERPSELKKVLNKASSNFLAEKVVFEGGEGGSVSSINRTNCGDGDGLQLIVALSGYWCGVVSLNESYQEQSRLNFAGLGFNTVETIDADKANSCRFLAYSYSKGVYLFDLEGKEKWKLAHDDNSTGHIDGVDFGDIDGDGKVEFAVYHRYGKGIHLVDEAGKTRWKHPINALGHLEIIDVDGNGKVEIIYDNSNNANGPTEFKILDEAGSIVKQLKIPTTSYEFAMVKWPNIESKPHILLTEDTKIRIVDLEGNPVIELDAPGCRPFGEVKALTVKFENDKPEYLAVKKRLFPDLSVLYVYDNEGKLVYQKTELVEGGGNLAFSVIPMNETGDEGLLVGSTRNKKPLVLEYSLSH